MESGSVNFQKTVFGDIHIEVVLSIKIGVTVSTPELVQACIVSDQIRYYYMGFGSPQDAALNVALSEFSPEDTVREDFNLKLGSNTFVMYSLHLASTKIDEGYRNFIESLAVSDELLTLPAWFSRAVAQSILESKKVRTQYPEWINCWFDFENHVIWTLSSQVMENLIKELLRLHHIWYPKV